MIYFINKLSCIAANRLFIFNKSKNNKIVVAVKILMKNKTRFSNYNFKLVEHNSESNLLVSVASKFEVLDAASLKEVETLLKERILKILNKVVVTRGRES